MDYIKDRILTGIQSTGLPHLGNLLSVILPTIDLANNKSLNPVFISIANLHSLTNIKNISFIKKYIYNILATWLACGLNTNKAIIYKQSDIPEVTELAWYLSCFFKYKRLTLVHSFKDKINNNMQSINVGVLTYPMLMAADILLYNAKIIPVGKDQLQHIEITRKVAKNFNRIMGKTFILPTALTNENTMYVTGTDGKKMSKSKNNIINVFISNEILKKQIQNIRTDNKSFQSSKDPNTNIIFSIYKLLASKKSINEIKNKYLNGNYGYFEAKNDLYQCILNRFSNERKLFNTLIKEKLFLDKILNNGAEKAREIAIKNISNIRNILGLK
ncbi:MAG: tryptophan--tRNA ligase [Candidatus Bostrichicola ureolyticus]|nr:MAG: tryptophan--tRNA ligase [Candidatus Bostrichicola ureolyticus]